MKVKILKPFQIIGNKAYPKGAIVDVNYDETTTKRLLKSGHFLPYVKGMEGEHMEVDRDGEDDFDDLDEDAPSAVKSPPKRATPPATQPRPRVRKPVPVAAEVGENDDEADESDPV